jgi:phage terminase large subunit-like protein
MSEVLEHTTLERWQRDPLSFINEVLRNPETGKPFELFDAQKTFFAKCWQTDDSGRLLYPEQCIGWPKKTGKTATAAMHLLTTTLVFGGRFAEGYAIANDLEQAQGRVFQSTRRICECSPHLQREYNITQSRIEFPQTGAVISAIAGDYAGAAGAHPVVPLPFDAKRLSLLEEICARGLTLPEIGDGLRGGNGMLFTWCHVPLAPWQDAHWLADMRRSLRPNQFARMVLNEFVSTDSAFVSMADWDRCVDPQLSPVLADRRLLVWVAIDASVKHDSTALAAVTFDTTLQKCGSSIIASFSRHRRRRSTSNGTSKTPFSTGPHATNSNRFATTRSKWSVPRSA